MVALNQSLLLLQLQTRLSKQKLSPAALPVSLLGHTRRHAAVQAAAAAAVPSASSASPGQQQQLDVPPGFDLPVAIALAAAAFEAYLEPVGANQQFKEVTVNNTHVTYTDRYDTKEGSCVPKHTCSWMHVCHLSSQVAHLAAVSLHVSEQSLWRNPCTAALGRITATGCAVLCLGSPQAAVCLFQWCCSNTVYCLFLCMQELLAEEL